MRPVIVRAHEYRSSKYPRSSALTSSRLSVAVQSTLDIDTVIMTGWVYRKRASAIVLRAAWIGQPGTVAAVISDRLLSPNAVRIPDMTNLAQTHDARLEALQAWTRIWNGQLDE